MKSSHYLTPRTMDQCEFQPWGEAGDSTLIFAGKGVAIARKNRKPPLLTVALVIVLSLSAVAVLILR